MRFTVVRSPDAQADIESFARYATNYSEDFAREQFARLNRIFSVELAQSPHVWSYFYITGAPYRAYLFRVGRRTSFWIIYTVDDEAKVVNVLRFWNASREPDSFNP